MTGSSPGLSSKWRPHILLRAAEKVVEALRFGVGGMATRGHCGTRNAQRLQARGRVRRMAPYPPYHRVACQPGLGCAQRPELGGGALTSPPPAPHPGCPLHARLYTSCDNPISQKR